MSISALCTPAWALPVFAVQAAGPAGYASSATAINATGVVVGNYALPDGTYRGYLWQNGEVTTLGLPAGAVQTWATAVSGAGQAAGYAQGAAGARGVVWDNLGAPGSAPGAYVMGLNATGDAVGMAIATDGTGYAFVTHDGTVAPLGQPAGGSWSIANAINGSGTAAGTAMNTSGAFQAFRAGADGSVSVLDGLGGANSYGMAINASGTVAGHAQTANGALLAAVWNGTGPLALGTLGGQKSYAYGINASGQVAGYSDLAGGAGTAAFLYDGGSLYDLNGLLAPESGWRLLAAYGINDSGQIAGRGLFQGEERAFLLTPVPPANTDGSAGPSDAAVPEPATLWLGGISLLALAVLRPGSRRGRTQD